MQIMYQKNGKLHQNFVSLQSGFCGLVRSTNKIKLELQPFETVTLSGLGKGYRICSNRANREGI